MLVITTLFFSENTNKKEKEEINSKQKHEMTYVLKCPTSKKNENLKECKVKYIQAPTQWTSI